MSEAGQQGGENFLLVLMCSDEFRKLNTETIKSAYSTFKSKEIFLSVKVRELKTGRLETHSSVSAALHTNRQKAFCHLIFHRKALFSKEKVWMCKSLIYLCPGAVQSAERVPCLAWPASQQHF